MHATGTYCPKFPEFVLESVEKKAYSAYTTVGSHLQFLELCLEEMNYTEMGKRPGLSVRTIEESGVAFMRNRTSLVM